MSDSILKFCPKCDSLFNYSNNDSGKLILMCNSCGFSVESDDTNILRTKYVQETTSSAQSYALPTRNTRYDKCMYRTAKLECKNPECESLDVTKWDEKPPEVLMFNQADENRIMYFFCVNCSKYWMVK